MVEIDGSYGEGGGQVVRTSLALSALTGSSVHIHRIRAGRRNPGLAPQHLTSVLAVAKVCDAEMQGAIIGSQELQFHPRSRPRAGDYSFDVSEAVRGGSAGSVTLILQSLLLPLAFADATSHLTLKGGTHVPWSPPFHYMAHVFLPTVSRMGLRVEMHLAAWGFYPVGGGRVTAIIDPVASTIQAGSEQGKPAREGQRLKPLKLTERGRLKRVWGMAAASNLPSHIPQRIANRARNVLAEAGLHSDIKAQREQGAGPGVGLFLIVEYEGATAGFSSLGERGKPSEQVADEASDLLLAHHGTGLPVDLRLGDQLLLPMALASGRSEFRTSRVTQHLITNAHVIRQFLPTQLDIVGKEGEAGSVAVVG